MHMPLLPALTLFIAAVIWFTTLLRRSSRKKDAERKSLEKYLEAEQQANFARSREIDEKLFVTVDITPFVFDGRVDIPADLRAGEGAFMKAAAKKMLRFERKLSNSELKIRFGSANLERLSGYEQNLTNYFIAGNFYAEILMNYNYDDMAVRLLEEMAAQTSDISRTYTLLADAYDKKRDKRALGKLKETVEGSNLPLKEKILKHISSLYDDSQVGAV